MKGISLGLALICGTLFAAAIQCAERLTSQEVRHYEIREGVVMDQLTSWSLTANIQVGCSLDNDSDTAARVSRRGRALVGDYTPLQALQLLMKAHGLQYQEVNPYTLYVKASDQQPDPKWLAEDKKAGKIETPKQPVVTLPTALSDSVVVTGSRLDYRRDEVATVANTLIVFDEKEISRLGVSTVGELLKYTPQQPYGPRAAFATERGSQVAEMRGLTAGTTLVLINGRRAFLSANAIVLDSFDLESIPISGVERVEVLSDSASAVYGSDAIGGVVNIITKRSIKDPLLELHAGAADGGAAERRASFSIGLTNTAFEGTLNIDAFTRDILLGKERDRWKNQDFRRFGGQDWRVTTGNPGNVRSISGENLPGLNSRAAAVPLVPANSLLTLEDFLPTEGQTNLSSPHEYWSAVTAADKYTASAFIKAAITTSLNAYAEGMHSSRRNELQLNPIARTLTVPASNFYNPFKQTVAVDYSFLGLGPQVQVVDLALNRFVVGLSGTFDRWTWDLSTLAVRDQGSSRTHNLLNSDALNNALSSSNPEYALNVFSPGPGATDALLSSLRRTGNYSSYQTEGTQTTAIAQAPLGELPAGHLRTLIGAERISSSAMSRGAFQFSGRRSLSAVFLELEIPLVNQDMNVTAMQDLRLRFAGRYDSYSDFGSTFNPRVALAWKPFGPLTLHSSYNTSFRAPSLLDMDLPLVASPSLSLPDPLRDNELVPVDVIGGGNRDLDPTIAETLTAGFSLEPTSIDGLKVGSTIWRIRLKDRVTVIPYLTLVRFGDLFPDRIERDMPTPSDVAAGRPGRLRSVDLTRMNLGNITTQGIDIFGEYNRTSAFGDWLFKATATWIDQYRMQNVPSMPAIERVAVANPDGTIARWRAIASIEWKRGGWGASATARYTSQYLDINSFLNFTGRTIKPPTLIDIQASFDADFLPENSYRLAGLKIIFGVENAFNEAPAFSEMSNQIGFDTSQGTLRMRFSYFRLSKSF